MSKAAEMCRGTEGSRSELPSRAVLSNSVPLAVCGYRGLDMRLVQIERCCNYRLHATFPRLSTKKKHVKGLSNFYIGHMLKC